jgi:hypothetical protein
VNRKQPNEQTWSHQSTQWATLILSYARHHRLFRLELTDESCDTELFRNKTIDRTLPFPSALLELTKWGNRTTTLERTEDRHSIYGTRRNSRL